jgi:acetolactate synthase-1/2/3 large subunit
LLGNLGVGCAKETAEAADVILLVGFKSGQNSTFTWKFPRADQKLIHLDVDPAEIGKVFPTEVGLVGDAKLGLRALVDAIRNTQYATRNTQHAERLKWLRSLRASWQREVGEALTSNDTPIKPQRVMEELNALTSEDDIVCCDASYVTGWGMMFYNVRKAGKVILAPRGSAGLGFGIPAAIGAACARPDAKAIALCGDHGVCYALGELPTAVFYGLNVKVIVFNNRGSRWIDHWHRMYFNGTGEPFQWGDTDFATVGKGFGCFGVRVEQPDDLADALQLALTHDGPAVVDVIVSGEETPIAAYRTALDEREKVGYHG